MHQTEQERIQNRNAANKATQALSESKALREDFSLLAVAVSELASRAGHADVAKNAASLVKQ
jgi:hypothetical protein